MTTTPPPDVPLPAGAAVADDWQPGPAPYRIVLGTKRRIGEVEVQTSVAQFADGTIDHAGKIELPTVHVQAYWGDNGLTAGQARQLARALIAAADELDGWADER